MVHRPKEMPFERHIAAFHSGEWHQVFFWGFNIIKIMYVICMLFGSIQFSNGNHLWIFWWFGSLFVYRKIRNSLHEYLFLGMVMPYCPNISLWFYVGIYISIWLLTVVQYSVTYWNVTNISDPQNHTHKIERRKNPRLLKICIQIEYIGQVSTNTDF